jgi:amino acid transporter
MSQYAGDFARGSARNDKRPGTTGELMTEHSPTAIPMPVQVPAVPQDRLEPNAIGVAQDTIIGLASSAPAATIAVTLAALAATAAYGGGPVIVLCGIPMLILANTYRRLNLWNANCGASFEWVGRAINPYLGFIVGWLMLAGCLAGTISVVVVLSPAVLAVFGASAASTWPNILISTAVIVVMAVIAAIGIRITAHTQVGMAVIEYVILIGFAAWALVDVLRHGAGTFPITRSWFSLTGIGGKGDLAAGLLIAVFMYTGWDATVYVNEEVTHRRVNPGRAAVFAVALLVILYAVPQVAMQGVASPAQLQQHSSSALVFVAQVLGGGGWAKVMAIALALSVIASTGTGIVITSRIAYGMASHQVLPSAFANVSPRHRTPITGTAIIAVILIAATWAYLLSSSIATVFSDVVSVTGLLFATFYLLTALAAVTYYRRRIFSNARDALTVGILPVAAAVFLGWVITKSLQTAPASEKWSIVGILAVGLFLMLVARFGLRAPFFQIPLESASREG